MVRRTAFLSNTDADYLDKRLATTERDRVAKLEADRKKTKESDTPAWKLFNLSFPCLIPAIYLYTDEQLEEGIIGDNIHGGSKDVISTMGREQRRNLRPFEMVIIGIENDGDFRFINPDDAADVYDILCDHLHAWLDYMQDGHLNGISVPWMDLMNIDKLAAKVFQLSRTTFGLEDFSNDTMTTKEEMVMAALGWKEELNVEACENGYYRNVATEHESIFDLFPEHLIPEEVFHNAI